VLDYGAPAGSAAVRCPHHISAFHFGAHQFGLGCGPRLRKRALAHPGRFALSLCLL